MERIAPTDRASRGVVEKRRRRGAPTAAAPVAPIPATKKSLPYAVGLDTEKPPGYFFLCSYSLVFEFPAHWSSPTRSTYAAPTSTVRTVLYSKMAAAAEATCRRHKDTFTGRKDDVCFSPPAFAGSCTSARACIQLSASHPSANVRMRENTKVSLNTSE